MIQHHSPDKIAEDWAVCKYGMKKAKTNQPGYDGILPDERKLQVKSKSMGHIQVSEPMLTYQKI